MESAKQFLEGAKKSSNLFCSSASHQNKGKITSIYCRGCEKPLCCSCAFLDREHTNLCCDIHLEIQRRQEELGSMSTELQGKKKHYEDAYNHLQGQANHLEQVKKETKELIQQKVAEMLQLVQQQGEELQTMVENRHQLERQDIEGKLQHMEAVLKRMASSERLVEKMYLYASEQEVMDMHPFIRKSLAGLKKEQPPAVGARVQAGDMAECKAKLQAMYERVTGKKDAASRAAPATSALAALPAREVVSKNELEEKMSQLKAQGVPAPVFTINLGEALFGVPPSIASPTKRRLDQTEKAMQTLPKVLKLEANDYKMSRTASKEEQDNTVWSQQPGASTSTPRRDSAGATAKRVDLSVEQMSTCSESCEPEEPTIVLSSSEETDDDTMGV
uniref:B box-type domain-containing protein n=1 Tax=Sphenodon punctatus TaxID=8508 RepID=A0A8D0GGX8_SPHPU